MTATFERVIAIIPARGASERVPCKNLLPLARLPLVAHTIRAAREAEVVDAVYVSTDDPGIARVAASHGAIVIERPAELAGPTATSESALLHVLDERLSQGLADPELVVFLQCTSPARRAHDVDDAVAHLRAEGADSLFSACRSVEFVWERRDGVLQALTYDVNHRPREQELGERYRENGSIYIFAPPLLREEGNRLGGRIAVYAMDVWSSFQLDQPKDVELLEWVLRRPEYAPTIPWPTRIDLVVFDFDGVMTDDTVLVSEDGHESVRCDRSDGAGIAALKELGVPLLVVSAERSPVVEARCRKLGLPFEQGVTEKRAFLEALLADRHVDPAHVIYLGNDVNDVGCLRHVGLPVAVADAHPEALAAARVILSRPGGHGAVRELCDALAAHFAGDSRPAGATGPSRAPGRVY